MTPALLRPVRRAAFASALAIAAAPFAAAPAKAQSFDMDCKVILCMAGGFPAPDCGDAYRYMIDRITRTPPLPPFGYCAMSDGTEYTAHNTHYRRLNSRSPSGWDCPDGLNLFFEHDDEGRGVNAFCYTHTTTRSRREDRETIYHGRQPAHAVNYELQITLEPGTAHEWVSPLFRINYLTGYRSQS